MEAIEIKKTKITFEYSEKPWMKFIELKGLAGKLGVHSRGWFRSYFTQDGQSTISDNDDIWLVKSEGREMVFNTSDYVMFLKLIGKGELATKITKEYLC